MTWTHGKGFDIIEVNILFISVTGTHLPDSNNFLWKHGLVLKAFHTLPSYLFVLCALFPCPATAATTKDVSGALGFEEFSTLLAWALLMHIWLLHTDILSTFKAFHSR